MGPDIFHGIWKSANYGRISDNRLRANEFAIHKNSPTNTFEADGIPANRFPGSMQAALAVPPPLPVEQWH